MPQLDVLRCAAILLVLGAHPVVKWNSPADIPVIPYVWYCMGWTGVDLFFVLSGFLVAGLLFSEIRATGTVDIPRFLIRRGLKIWPSYYVYLSFVGLILWLTGEPIVRLLPFLVHVQNYSAQIHHVAGHTWSLAVEEHFYLALPFVLCVAMPQCRCRSVVACTAIAAAACMTFRAFAVAPLPPILTHHRIDSLAFGVLLAYVYHYHKSAFHRMARRGVFLVILGLALVVVATVPNPFLSMLTSAQRSAIAPTMIAAGYGGCLVWVVSTSTDRGLVGTRIGKWMIGGLAAIGAYSYPIYLWHVDSGYKVVDVLVRKGFLDGLSPYVQWTVGMALYAAVAVGTGVLLSRRIEAPVLALRDRLFPRASGSSVPGLMTNENYV